MARAREDADRSYVTREAELRGLHLESFVEMPASNLSVVLSRR